MANRQLNVNLAFNASTEQAKSQIQSLVNELNKLSSGNTITSGKLPLTKDIQEAQQAAKELSVALSEATNANTGKLDLTKFSNTLRNSGKNLTDYSDQLTKLGAEGDKAFLGMAQAIATAEAPLKRSSKLLDDFALTMKNTVKWQISSSILHGFMGSVQSAKYYAQDLNKSLNDIRIVTGYNTDQMADFADQANKAAKALSTTTTRYTDASLVYFQQGLSNQEVQERADITVKMANVTDTSAQEVSDQLTAVWNNFYDGSKSLEYFIDVMVRLGADTASSTDEISEGLNKFAAVADSVGLSYEYAASALATVTATTRESADVVGNAYKTLFSRIQGLQLGETLDDGTTLNKYSNALKSVGIDIKETNGELKGMDIILSELGLKWQTLSRDTQVALAQTVGGARQYTQLIALLDNWDYFQENLQSAYGATGSLEEQAAIYAESWEASKDRVTAAVEEIYSSLIDEDFFIGLNDFLAGGLDGVSKLIDSLGGLKGVITALGVVFTTVFKEQLANGINNSIYNIQVATGIAERRNAEIKKQAYDLANAMTVGLMDDPAVEQQRQALQDVYTLQEELRVSAKDMSFEQRQAAEEAVKAAKTYSEAAVEARKASIEAAKVRAENRTKASEQYGKKFQDNLQRQSDLSINQTGGTLTGTAQSMAEGASKLIGSDAAEIQAVEVALRSYRDALHEVNLTDAERQNIDQTRTIRANALIATLNHLTDSTLDSSNAFDRYCQNVDDAARQVLELNSELVTMQQNLNMEAKDTSAGEDIVKLVRRMQNRGFKTKNMSSDLDAAMKEFNAAMQTTDTARQENALKRLKAAFMALQPTIENVNQAITTTAKRSVQNKSDLDNMGAAISQVTNEAREYIITQENYNNVIEQAKIKVDQAKVSLQDLGYAYQSVGSFVTGSMQALSSFAMAASAIGSIKDTLTNEDLSVFEKTLQIMMSLSMAIPAATQAWKAFGDVKAYAIGKTTEGLAAQVAQMLGLDEEIVKTGYVIIGKKGEKVAREEAGNAAAIEAARKAGSTVVTEIDTAATWKNILAKQTLLKTLGIFALKAAVVAAAVWGLVQAWQAYQAATPEGQLASAEERADKSAEALSRVKDSVNEVKNSLEQLKSSQTALEDLKVGTEEWTEAVSELNLQIIQLLDKFPQLSQYITSENGVMNISQEGIEALIQEQNSLLAAATNVATADKLSALNARNKVESRNFEEKPSYEFYDEELVDNRFLTDQEWDKINQAITEYYRNDNVGELLFEDLNTIAAEAGHTNKEDAISGAEALVNALFDTNHMTEEEWNQVVEEMQDYLETNQDGIRAMAQRLEEAEILEKTLIESRMQSIGSNKTADEVLKMFDASSYEDLIEQTGVAKKVKDTFAEKSGNLFNLNGWNYTKDYNEDDPIYDQIEAFMAIKGSNGENVKYVGQSWGKLVLEIDGEEEKFSKDDVWDALAEKYAGPELEQMMATKFTERLNNALSNINIEAGDINIQDLSALDNFMDGLVDYYSQDMDTSAAEDAMRNQMQKIYDAALANPNIAGEDPAETISNYVSQFDQLDLSDAGTWDQIERLSKSLGDGVEDADALTAALNRLNEAAKLENMDSYFEKAAQLYEMDDGAAQEMKEYAEYIMEISEESGYFADRLIEDAQSAADLSIQISRLNKGIKTLGENFEDWGSILKKSSKESQEYFKAFKNVRSALSDILNVEENLIDTEFVDKHFKEINEASYGSEEAIQSLQNALSEEIIQDVIIKITNEKGEEGAESVITEIQSLHQQIQDWEMPNIAIGAYLDDSGFTEAANLLVQNSQMTADQANAYFAKIGYRPVYRKADIPVTNEVPNSQTIFEPQPAGVYESTGSIQMPGSDPQTFSINIPMLSYTQKSVELPPTATEGKQELMAFSGEETPPTIANFQKIASPSSSNYSSSNSGGTPSRKPSSGGGGNKSNSTPKLKDTKKASKEIERYHEIKEALQDTAQDYDRINKARERAYGPDKIKLMDQSIEKQQQLMNQQKQYLNEIATYHAADKKALEAYGGVIDSVTGQILNYDEIMNAQLAKFNASRTEEAEKEYEAFKEVLEQYEETNNLLQEQQDELTEIQNQIYDLKLEKIELNLELNTEIQDDALEYLDHLLNTLQDDAADAADALALLTKSTEANLKKIAATEEAIDAIIRNHGIKDINAIANIDSLRDLGLTEEEVETLRDYRSELLEANEELMDLKEEAVDRVISAFEDWNDQLDKNLDKFDHYNEVLTTFNDIIELVGTDALGITQDMMTGLADAAVDNSINKLEASRHKMEELRNAEAEARAKLQAATSEEEIQMWESVLEEIEDQTNSAEEDMLSNWQDALDAAAEAFEQTVETVIANYEKAMSGTFGSFDDLQRVYDQQAEISERYVADYKEIYELNKLNRDITNSINDNDSIKAKKALRELQAEVNELQESEVQMSQYDLDYMRKKYELRLAEIALEEAQDAKSQVRMRRDTEGNYSYVFTADQNAIDEATQKYEDQLYEMQELNSQYIQEMQDNILQSEIELANALRDLDKAKFASDEEYYKAVSDLTAYYGGQRDYYLDEMNKGLENNKTTYQDDWANYSALTGYKMSADDEYVDSFNETQLAQINGYKSIEDAQNQYRKATEIMVNDLKTAFTTWQQNMNDAMVAAGTTLDQFGNTLVNTIYGDGSEDNKGITGASQDALDAVTSLTDQMNTLFSDSTLNMLADWADNYVNNILPVIEQNLKLADSINQVIAAEAGLSGQRTVTPEISGTGPNAVRFNTGGYTGTWEGDKAKLAFLDKKELILKENDTANMLKSLEVLNQITRVIDLNAGAQLTGLRQLSSSTVGETSQSIEQHIEIQAEFPNATNKDEIQEAFSSLFVQASQFANRKNK